MVFDLSENVIFFFKFLTKGYVVICPKSATSTNSQVFWAICLLNCHNYEYALNVALASAHVLNGIMFRNLEKQTCLRER